MLMTIITYSISAFWIVIGLAVLLSGTRDWNVYFAGVFMMAISVANVMMSSLNA